MTLSLVSHGVAFPRLVLPSSELADAWGPGARGVDERRVPAFDEDAITLGVEAASRALAASRLRAEELRTVVFASAGTAPGASVVAEAVGASRARAVDLLARASAGAAAVSSAAREEGPALVVAADIPRAAPGDPAESREGAAAAAFVLGSGPGARPTFARGAVGDGAVARALEGAPRPDALVRSPPGGPVADASGKPFEGLVERSLVRRTATAGAAQPLVDLAHAISVEGVGRRILVVASEERAAEVLAVEVEAAVAGTPPEAALARGVRVGYLRALRSRGVFAAADPLPEEPMGAFVPFPAYHASIPARWRLEGGRCEACGRPFLPAPSRCPDCAGRIAPHAFPRRGVVHAATVIARGAAPSEFAETQRQEGEIAVAIVELEGGARAVGQLAAEEEGEPSIGEVVEPVFRRLYRQQGIVRYGMKWRRMAD